MSKPIFFAFALVLIACEYRAPIGRTGDAASDCSAMACPDASDELETRSDASPRTSCSTFERPSGDCTLGGGSCTFDLDCTGDSERCNGYTGRCFSDLSRCVGTPCTFDEDCPSSESCNEATSTCFDPREDQTCMPCFLSDSDCGQEQCVEMTCRPRQ